MKILHICAGWQKWNGAANIARMIMDEQRREGHEVSFATWAKVRELRTADEVWIHCGWLPCLWWAALWGRNVHWMPEACYDPVRLRYHGWKKLLVGPIERWCLRRCAKIVATCEAEKGWIEKYLGKRCPEIEVMDVKRFFDVSRNHLRRGYGGQEERKERKCCVEERGLDGRVERVDRVEGGEGSRVENGEVHLLYLGRRHPLKGVEYLEKAVAELNSNPVNPVNPVQNSSTRSICSTRLKIISSAFGEELEKVWDWCDVLVLPTLSENFGLVVAEALERGKCVITTDGAPAWGEGLSRVEHVDRVDVSRNHLRRGYGGQEERKERKDDSCEEERGLDGRVEHVERVEGGVWSGYGGQLIYLKGYRDGTDEERVELLKKAMERICK